MVSQIEVLQHSANPGSEISGEDQALIAELSNLVSTQSPDFEVYSALVDVLRSHNLSHELDGVREQMSQHFALTEAMWLDWLQDTTTLTSDDKLLKLDRHARSVTDNSMSVKLWLDYLSFLEGQCSDDEALSHNEPLDDVFNTDLLESVYQTALTITKFHLQDGHLIWSKWKERQIQLLDRGRVSQASLMELFLDRLSIPHSTIAETFEQFSTFVTAYDNSNYEDLMQRGNKFFQQSRSLMADREEFEATLAATGHAHESYLSYTQWQQDQSPKSPYYQELNIALLSRAILLNPSRPEFWDQLYNFHFKFRANQLVQTQQMLKQSVRHCPKDGELWAHLIRVCDKLSTTKDDILSISDRALAAVEQNIYHVSKIVSATFLALRAGLTSSKANVTAADVLAFMDRTLSDLRRSGLDDPDFVLDRLLIDARTINDRIHEARQDWKSLIKIHGSKAMFWLRYLQWELLRGNIEAARTLLKSGCMKTQDAPQIVYEASLTFEIQYGTTLEYEKTASVVRKATLQYLQKVELNVSAEHSTIPETEPDVSLKRKSDEEVSSSSSKRTKVRQESDDTAKRDRECTSVIVTGLGPETSSEQLTELFVECGQVRSIRIKKLQSDSEAAAIVEFDTPEDMSSARTRTLKYLNQRQIEVESARDTILFVSNWPPTYLAHDLEVLFEKHGKVLDVRMPSLMYDQNRRFAYVQMSSKAEALATLKLDNTRLEDKYLLTVKLSNPEEKQERKTAVSESRELFIKRISWNATKADLETLCEPYGKVVSLRMPATISPRHHDGIAFVEFESAESCQKALELHGKLLKNLALIVTLAESRPRNRNKKPAVHSNAKAQPMSNIGNDSYAQHAPPRSEIVAKTLGIMNLADTVSEVQLRNVFEAFGSLRKVDLRPDHGGAIVEYDNLVDAGKAALALEGHVISGKKIEIGTYDDLMRQDSAQVRPAKVNNSLMAPRKARLTSSRSRNTARGTGIVGPNPVSGLGQSPEVDKKVSDKSKKDQDFFRSLMQPAQQKE